MNWRKPLIYLLLYATGSKIPNNLKTIHRLAGASRDEVLAYQEGKLKKLLLYAHDHVPYYSKLLKESELFKDNQIYLENFDKIPVLTKDIIRREGSNLYSKEQRNGVYENTSGGSTGEPVKFLQDRHYDEWNIANKLYFFNEWFNKKVGEAEINIWGSERDIYRNSLSIKERIINFLYNRTFLNSFKVSEDKLSCFVDTINKTKPVSMWCYVESIDLLANFVKKNNINTYSPKFIITTAGTLYSEIRKNIEDVFSCSVYNQYGSREVGVIAIECKQKKGLHDFFWSNYIEVIDTKIYITSLNNFAMPIIRYDIGDIAIAADKYQCACGCNNLKFREIKGREICHFKTKDGNIIHGQYFIHQFYFIDWVKKFQIVQKDYDVIECRIVLNNNEINTNQINKIEQNIKLVMGYECKIIWTYLDEVLSLSSGKYLYTMSQVN